MTDRLLAVVIWLLGIGTLLIVSFAIAAMVGSTDALGTTLPRSGWVVGLIAWGIGGGGVTLALGRATSDGWPARTPLGLMLLLSTVVAAVAIELTVMWWAADRFGVQAADPDLIGWSSLLSPLVVLVGLATLASTVLPGDGRTAAQAVTLVAGAGVLLVVGSNVPGASDGVTPLGFPMGIAMAAGTVVTVAAVAAAVVGRRRAQLPER